MAKLIKRPDIALRRREAKINKEFYEIRRELWEQHGLNRAFPRNLLENSTFYNEVATTEQRTEIDDAIEYDVLKTPGSGTIEHPTCSFDFIDNMDKYLS